MPTFFQGHHFSYLNNKIYKITLKYLPRITGLGFVACLLFNRNALPPVGNTTSSEIKTKLAAIKNGERRQTICLQ